MSRARSIILLVEQRTTDDRAFISYLKSAAEKMAPTLFKLLDTFSSHPPVVVKFDSTNGRENYNIHFDLDEAAKKPSKDNWLKAHKFVQKFNNWSDISKNTNRNVINAFILIFDEDLLTIRVQVSVMTEQKNVSKYLYHETLKTNIPSIMEKGLVPTFSKKGGNWEYAEGRVFFVQRPIRKDEVKNPGKRVQLKIDTQKLPHGTKFYGHTKGGEIIIEGNIPPSAIVAVEELI